MTVPVSRVEATTSSDLAEVVEVRFEHLREALGIGDVRPRLSWKVVTEEAGWSQCAYELEVHDPRGGSRYSTGRVTSADSVLVPWPGPDLTSRERRVVRVRVWRSHTSAPSAWSDHAEVEAGLLLPSDWTASIITPRWEEDSAMDQPAPFFRRDFEVGEGIAAARLYVTAHGVYEIEINGRRVGDQVLAPGWTAYQDRLRYQTFDVASLLRVGWNAIGGIVGDGWFRGLIGFRGGRRNVYGDRVGLFAQLEIRYLDGASVIVPTDDHWRASRGPIRSSGLYPGEVYDARLEQDGWSEPGFDDNDWSTVRARRLDLGRLVAPSGPPVRRIETVAPIAIVRSPSGQPILDFGQNLVGRLRLRVRGTSGTELRLRHAEVLEDGELCTRPLRGANATDRYILRGADGGEEWEPRFTIHGFRYVEIAGWPGEVTASDVEAVVIHTDMERSGWFTCSDPTIDRLHENVVWSMRGNFVDIPTDCPQRDERLGWTGDLQVFAPTASFLYGCAGTLASWLQDLVVEQERTGTVPPYVPWIRFTFPATPIAAWGDAAVIVPWVLYERFGDPGFLERQFASMTRWVDQIEALAGANHRWEAGTQFGDWLDPTAPPDRPGSARTDPFLIATAYHALTTRIVSEAAKVLGRQDDADRYGSLSAAVRVAFNEEFVSPTGRVVGDTQTAYAVALQFDLIESATQRDRARARLVDLVAQGGHRIATGFVGTPLICDALAAANASDHAYHLLTQRECPSWLYPVSMGATTVWERWDSLLPDGHVNPGQMTSFNHYALGAIADWLHRVVAGLAPADVGYRRLLVAPRPGGGLRSAAASHETPYGRASVSWRRQAGSLMVDVTVPPGTTASVRLPDPTFAPVEVLAGRHSFTCAFRAPEDDPSRPQVPDLHSIAVGS